MQKSALKGGVLNFKATPHNSARNLSERFCASSKFRKRGNTVCIFRFWNCRTGAKDPLRSADVIVRCCLNFFNRFQTCYTTIAEAMSFLHSSCSHLQVQTVPSSAWDAPCPVVTPSCIYRLGSALSAINDNYVFWLSA